VVTPHPTLAEQEAAGCAAAFYPSLTTMAALQASWDFLNEFKAHGTTALEAFRAQAAQSKWGEMTNNRLTNLRRIREMEEKYLPKELQRDYDHTLGIRP
jgi:2-methylisocitrate lyase-like PEP mutase family enzyme